MRRGPAPMGRATVPVSGFQMDHWFHSVPSNWFSYNKNLEPCKLELTSFSVLVFSHSFLLLFLPSLFSSHLFPSVEITVFCHHFCLGLAGKDLQPLWHSLSYFFFPTKLLLSVKDSAPQKGPYISHKFSNKYIFHQFFPSFSVAFLFISTLVLSI